MRNLHKIVILGILTFLVWIPIASGQINVDRYLWEYPLQQDLVMDADLTWQIRDEMQKIIDSGSLIFRPVSCRYSDVMNDHYALYLEPGRILNTVALTYPYLYPDQQDSLRKYVAALFQSPTHKPWAMNQLQADNGQKREYYHADQVWGLGSTFGQYRPTIQNVYSIWHYVYRTGDTLAVEPYYNDIKSFYNAKVAAGVDPGNLYGSMCAHIGMARLANMFDDAAQVSFASNQLALKLNEGLNIMTIDSNAANGLNGWDAPYGREYESRQDNWVYRGYIFLNLSAEMGRFLSDEVAADVLERNRDGKMRFPYWWLRQAQYFCRWTGDEGAGIPTEMMGMVMPVDRWVEQATFETLSSYLLSAPLGVADCYWIESAVLALESNGTDQWIDMRIVPFATDVETDLMVWKGNVSNDWFNALNWENNKVPTVHDNVIIQAGPFDPNIAIGLHGFAKNVEIKNGAELIVRGKLNGN